MKRFFQVVVSFVLCYAVYLSGFNTYARASVINHVAPISPVKQAKSNWCWAASAEMFGESINYSSTVTQYDIVKHIKGSSEVNKTATILECLSACTYAKNCKTNITGSPVLLNFSEISRRVSFDQGIFTALSVSGGIGHAVVIGGTQFIDGNNGIDYNIDYLDPSDGLRHHCSYNDFCNGQLKEYKSYKPTYMIYSV